MAVLTCCDLCLGHPLDHEAQSGGDVKYVRLEIDAEVHEPVESRGFHGCAPCRSRVFGEIFEKIGVGPQTATAANSRPNNVFTSPFPTSR